MPLVGAQRPRLLVTPESLTTAGVEAVELAARAGLILDPWQQFALEVGLGERADGKWSAFEVCTVVARQNGKGALFEALALAKLVLFDSQLFIYSSHEFKTSREAFRRIGSLIDATPELSSRVLKTVKNPSEFGYDFRNGARLRFFARSGGSGRGWSADDLFFDEAFKLDGAAMAALLPTLSTRPNPQVWYASSAALADSEQLHALRSRALSSEPGERLAYLEWSAPDDVDIRNREAWAMANPALGYRLTEEFISAEVDALPEAQFRRERLSIPDMATGEAAIPAAAWHECADKDSKVEDPVVFGLDVDPNRAGCTIDVFGRRADGLPHVAVVDDRSGLDWVVDRCVELQRHNPLCFALDPAGPAGALLQPMREAGLDVVEVPTRGLTQACGQLYDLVMARTLRHRDEGVLNAAVGGATWRPVGDARAWARKSSASDIRPLYAATVALWAFGERDKPADPSVWFI